MTTYIFDIDGTLSHYGAKIHPVICNRIIELSHKNKIIFSSARPVRDMLPMVASELHKAIFIGCNGGILFENRKIVSADFLDRNYVSSIVGRMDKMGMPYVLDGEWGVSFSNVHHSFHDYIRSLSNDQVRKEELIKNGVTKILVLSDNNKNVLTNGIDVSIHVHKDGFYDITPCRNNKYNTLREIIGNDIYIAFGNIETDFQILDNAEVSVFIGSRNEYKKANYYAQIDYIPTIINFLENKKLYKEGV